VFREIKEGVARRGGGAVVSSVENLDDATELVSTGPADEHVKERMRMSRKTKGNGYVY
jgi:hypothetical protein